MFSQFTDLLKERLQTMTPHEKQTLQKAFHDVDAWNRFIESSRDAIEESILHDEFKTDCSKMTLDQLEKYKDSETFGTIIQKELDLRAHRQKIRDAMEHSLYTNTKSDLHKDLVYKEYWRVVQGFLGDGYNECSYATDRVSKYYEFCPRGRLYGKQWVRAEEVEFYSRIWMWGMRTRYLPWWEKHADVIIQRSRLNAFESYIGYHTEQVITELMDVEEFELVTRILHKVADKYTLMSESIIGKVYHHDRHWEERGKGWGLLYWCKCCMVMLRYADTYPTQLPMRKAQSLELFKKGCTKICTKLQEETIDLVCSGRDHFNGDVKVPSEVQDILRGLYKVESYEQSQEFQY